MRAAIGTIAGAALALSSCKQAADQNSSASAGQSVNAAPSEVPPIPPPGTGPDARTPLGEPRRAIDPTSVEAAGQVVQHYGALIEQERFLEAQGLWSDAQRNKSASVDLKLYSEVHLEIGNPGKPEGAAGSIYVTEPVTFYGKLKSGKGFRKPASIVLRRVNDVPGSTEAERRWQIERIEWKDGD